MKRRTPMPTVRMSKEEKIIVGYITERLEMAYRDTRGKAVYARSMDQVMNDIFGMKKFTKTLTRARYNESLMISLMKTLDTETLWAITRSKEHYRLLCTLVAMDHYIVKLGKKYNRMAETDLADRPTNKMRKTAKEIKRCKKMYKDCIKAFRDIFEIEKVDDKKSSIFESLESWLERHDGNDDIFYGYGDLYDSTTIESMDEYIASHSKKGGKRARAPKEGALDILHGSNFMDTGYGYDEDDEDEDDLSDSDTMDYLVEKIVERVGKRLNIDMDDEDVSPRRGRSTGYSYGDDQDDEDDDDDSSIAKALNRLATSINDGFGRLSNEILGLYDVMTEEEEEDGGPVDGDLEEVSYEISRPTPSRVVDQVNRPRTSPENAPQMNIGEMIEMSEQSVQVTKTVAPPVDQGSNPPAE